MNLKRGVWLLMAVFCMFCSSAIKKMIQIRAEQHSSLVAPVNHNDQKNDSRHPVSKRIKDGSRERREFLQQLVVSFHQDTDHDTVPGLLFLVPFLLLAFTYFFAGGKQFPVASGKENTLSPIPLYLQLCRLQV